MKIERDYSTQTSAIQYKLLNDDGSEVTTEQWEFAVKNQDQKIEKTEEPYESDLVPNIGMIEVNLTLLNEVCDAFVIESNPHIIQGITALEYAEKLIGEVDLSVIEEMIDFNTIYKVKAWIGMKKIVCVDFDLESAVETVYEAVKNHKP